MRPRTAGIGLRVPSHARPVPAGPAPIPAIAFLGVGVASLGGPLALAAQLAPSILADAWPSAGLAAFAGSVLFVLPLAVWLRYAGRIAGSGGLYDYVRAAAGPRTALIHAALWIFSYALYLVYTMAAVVYDTLPVVLPWIRPYQRLLEIGIPIVLAAIMLAGRTITLAVLGVLAAGQLALVATLAAVTIGHDAPAGSFAASAPTADIASASGQVALLYVCGSLPLYLGGELARPGRTIRRGLTASYGLVAAGVIATVFPLAANPAFLRAPIPGMAVAQVFSGRGLAVAVGIGVAASTAGVMLIEYLALSRLLHVVTGRPVRRVVAGLAVVLVVSAPLTLIDPDRIYDDLLKPSLIALWLSQLIVFVVYRRFAARRGRALMPHVGLALGAPLFAVYGMYATLHGSST